MRVFHGENGSFLGPDDRRQEESSDLIGWTIFCLGYHFWATRGTRFRFIHTSNIEIANAINLAFLEPMVYYQPLNSVPIQEEGSVAPAITEPAVQFALTKLNPRKAAGPDGIADRNLREYTVFLVQPITSII